MVSEETPSYENDSSSSELYDPEDIRQEAESNTAKTEKNENDEIDLEYEPEIAPSTETTPEKTDELSSAKEKASTQLDPSSDHDSDYDPSQLGASTSNSHEEQKSSQPGHESDDDYNPENTIKQTPSSLPKIPQLPAVPRPAPIPKTSANLPPKPPVNASTSSGPVSHIPSPIINDAYGAVMQSDLVRSPHFLLLAPEQQQQLIQAELQKRNISLDTDPADSNAMNYDQVYSYNKPFVNMKNPIPLVPTNPYCRRPNLMAPMSEHEETEYANFLQRESHFMSLDSWDEFPDKSRLFIGNLPANTISKKDLFRIFSKYGEVVQILMKAGYGFVQFQTSQSCLDSIRGETDVPLHNKIMRLDTTRPQKNRHEKRGRDSTGTEGQDLKRHKREADCIIYVTGESSVFFVRQVKKAFASANITYDTQDIPHSALSDAISDAAYSGILGACVVKNVKVDLQVFESSPEGGIRFDEYAEIDPESAVDILSRAKGKKLNGFRSHDGRDGYRLTNSNRERINHSNNGRNRQNHSNYGSQRDLYHKVSFVQPPSAAISEPQGAMANQGVDLVQKLQSMDPGSLQSMISILQQQQIQNLSVSNTPVPAMNGFAQFGGNFQSQYPPPPLPGSSPTNQVNSLLSQLQGQTNQVNHLNTNQVNHLNSWTPNQTVNQAYPTGNQEYTPNNQAYDPSSGDQQPSAQTLMDTLARLSRK